MPLFTKKSDQETTGKYPDWNEVRKDPAFLPDRMLNELQKAMIFIVMEKGKEHAAVIVRADKSEFQKPVTSSTPIRLYIGFYSGRYGDIFSVYPLVLDNPRDPAFKETWIKPYEDNEGIQETDPLSAESRKRLKLLFSQKYTWMLFINNRNQIIFDRKVKFTPSQLQTFKQYNQKLAQYKGKKMSKMVYISLLQEYLNTVPMAKLRNEFLKLFR
jgi:hypothetical protein